MYVPYLFSLMQLIISKELTRWEYNMYIFWVYLFTTKSVIQESIQLFSLGLNYFFDPYNYVETTQIIFNVVLIKMNKSGGE